MSIIIIKDITLSWRDYDSSLVRLENIFDDGDAWDSQSLRKQLDRATHIFAAFERDKLVGYLSTETKDDFTLYVWNVVIDKEYQGRGIGRKLIRTLKVREHKKNIALHVKLTNVPAVRLYKREKFVQVGNQPYRYNDGSDGAEFLFKAK